jgi:hypothetical protein
MTLTADQKETSLRLWHQGKSTYDIATALGGKSARVSESMVWDFITAYVCNNAMKKHI